MIAQNQYGVCLLRNCLKMLHLAIFGLACFDGVILSGDRVSLFDGMTLQGWEGDRGHGQAWRVRDGHIVGGALDGNARPGLLATKKSFDHFRLSFDFKLHGAGNFVNGGVRFRGHWHGNSPENMVGYLTRFGVGRTGSLYKESPPQKMLAQADGKLIRAVEHPGEWNTCEVLALGNTINIFLNGVLTATWVEDDDTIPRKGLIALEISEGGIAFRNIHIETLSEPSIPPEDHILSRFGKGQPRHFRNAFTEERFEVEGQEMIVMVGQENFVREQNYPAFESIMTAHYASKRLSFRSMAWEADTVYEQWRDLNFGSWSDQLRVAEADIILVQFGQMEAMDGPSRLPEFAAAYHRLLDLFAQQTRRLILVSPMPFERPIASHAPDLTELNDNVALYSQTVKNVARARKAVFVDLFTALSSSNEKVERLTEDGIHLTPRGLEVVGEAIARQLGVVTPPGRNESLTQLRKVIQAKNRLWFDAWRPANWSFAYGDRVAQMFGRAFGQGPSLHGSLKARGPMIANYESIIHKLVNDEPVEIPSLYTPAAVSVSPPALTPKEEASSFELADGYQVNLYASEHDGVVNPTQMAWDASGRLFVACSPSYPQSLASVQPADYILILEDLDHDGKADKSWKYADGLNMIQGLEPGPEGLYVCDFDQIIYLKDDDGDLQYDSKQLIFSGFGVGDTHQLINSVTHGMDGTLWFTQGLHAMSVVETPWGIKRLDRAAVWRFEPRTLKLEGFFGGGMAGANCWGIAFDDFGQVFHKSGDRPHGYWTVPGMVHGANPSGSGSRTMANQSYANSPEQYHTVGAIFDSSPKTTSIDIVGTRAMPEEIQGAALIGGYFGSVVELHRFYDDGAGFGSVQLPRVMQSTQHAFRPVDVSMGPDGAMYLADWYNEVIGHYQASYLDPRRDKHHGRIWRITSTQHPPVEYEDLANMDVAELLDKLKSPERWIRYQAKRLLFYKPTQEVLKEADAWLNFNSGQQHDTEQWLIELAGVYQSHEAIREDLLKRLMNAQDFRVRAYGARVAGDWANMLDYSVAALNLAVRDQHPRVRLEGAVACSYLDDPIAVDIATQVLHYPTDKFIDYALRQTCRALQTLWEPVLRVKSLTLSSSLQEAYLNDLAQGSMTPLGRGERLYQQACMPCHQQDGKGLPGVYPSIRDSNWIAGNADRLIKITLHGLRGEIEINEVSWNTSVSLEMPAFGGLADEQISILLSHLRSTFGNNASEITSKKVHDVRLRYASRQNPWTMEELE